MRIHAVINRPLLAGQYAVTRPGKQGIFRTRYYQSLTDAAAAKGRTGVIARVINVTV